MVRRPSQARSVYCREDERSRRSSRADEGNGDGVAPIQSKVEVSSLIDANNLDELNATQIANLWLDDAAGDEEQSTIPRKGGIIKTTSAEPFAQRLAKRKLDNGNNYATTVASNLFSLDPNVGIAVNFGKTGMSTAHVDATANPGRPTLLRSASIGDFPESMLPTRRCSLLPSKLDNELSSKPASHNDTECSTQESNTLVKPYHRPDMETNDPHPSLEFPPLYFILKKWPWLLNAVKYLYLIRWRVSYPLQRRVPCSQYFRKVGVHATWGEFILIMPFFAVVVIGTLWSFLYPSVSITGQVSRLPLIFAFATAMHNSFLSLLLGMPFERALWYHKLAGRIAFVNGILHTYVAFFYPDDDHSAIPSGSYAHVSFENYLIYDMENITGLIILALVTGILITSVPFVRNKFFEFFYYTHIVFAVSMAGCAFYHSGKLVPILVAATWGMDLIMRKLIMAGTRYPRKAQTRIISNTVVELRMQKIKGFDFNPGQYVYICVPQISLLEWHPFSISSSPGQKMVTLHIRKVGNWTSALHELAQTKEEIPILLEGPFGSVGVDLTSSRYSMVMLVSGGIGITPMQSICNQLIFEHGTQKRTLKKLSFLWMERDPIVMSDVEVVRRSSSVHFDTTFDDSSVISDLEEGLNHSRDEHFPMSIASAFLANVPPSRLTDSDLDHQYNIHFDMEEMSHDDTLPAPRRGSLLAAISDMPPAIARRLSLDNRLFGRTTNRTPPTGETTPSPGLGGRNSLGNNDNNVHGPGRRNSNGSLGPHSGHTCKTAIGRNSSQRPNLGRDGSMLSLGMSDRPVFGDEHRNELGDDDTFLKTAYTHTVDFAPTNVLDMQVYLTSKDPNSCFANLPFVHEGRPDLKKKFLQMREEAIASGENRVAVCVCAPAAIVAICQKASIKFSDHRVQFDFHSEVFG